MNFRHGIARTWTAIACAAFLAGCANMKSHDTQTTQVMSAGRSGGIPGALAQLESAATTPAERAEVLYNMERGELLRLNRQYPDSTAAYLLADVKVKEWEESAKTNPSKLFGTAGAALISERLKVYEGQDYEKVFLTTRLAMNRVAVSDFDNARVDIKRTHEREAVIAEFRAKETVAAEEQAKSQGATVQGKELNGYPTESLNDPEVLALKNGYQNALSHYLAGFLYEALNEPGLAAPGYRKAIELKPNAAVLEEGLRGLDTRSGAMGKRRQRMTDVLFVVEAGNAPARKPQAFTVPVPTGRAIRTVSISYPVIEPSRDPLLGTINVGGTELRLEKIVDVNVMARRALKDEMPGMILRGVTRAIAKGVVQDQLQKKGGLLGAVVGSVASAATENADDRIWRMLPGRVYVARGYLPPGDHRVLIDGRDYGVNVGVDGQYAMVSLRLNDASLLNGDVGMVGRLAAGPAPAAVAAQPAAEPVAPARSRPARPARAARPAAKAKAAPVPAPVP